MGEFAFHQKITNSRLRVACDKGRPKYKKRTGVVLEQENREPDSSGAAPIAITAWSKSFRPLAGWPLTRNLIVSLHQLLFCTGSAVS